MGHRRLRVSSTRTTWAVVLLSVVLLAAVAFVAQRSPVPRSERSRGSQRTENHRPDAGATAPHAKRSGVTSRGLAEDPELSPRTLVARLERSDLGERMAAIELMRGREEPAILQTLGRTLSDPDPDVRRAAFRAVVDLASNGGESPELTALLRQALSDSDARVRIDALDALAERGAGGLAAIREAVADPSEEVGEYARHLLERAQLD